MFSIAGDAATYGMAQLQENSRMLDVQPMAATSGCAQNHVPALGKLPQTFQYMSKQGCVATERTVRIADVQMRPNARRPQHLKQYLSKQWEPPRFFACPQQPQ